MSKNNYLLNDRETESFYELLEAKKNLIPMALRKVKIPNNLHQEFYSYALEGLLISFLTLNEGKIEEKDFDRYAFTVIKRKLIDDNCSLVYIQLLEYLKNTLSEKEMEFFHEFVKTVNIKQVAKYMNISLATAYRLHKRIKEICEEFLLDK